MGDVPAIKTFQFKTDNLRVENRSGDPWFVESDAKRLLGLTKGTYTRHLLASEKGTSFVQTPGGRQRMNVINESGLYKLIMRSNKAEAEPFQNWVTSEVLPSIRKAGHYEMKSVAVDTDVAREELALRWLDVEMKIDAIFEIPKICSFQEAVKKIKGIVGVDLSGRLALTPHANALPAADEFLEIAELTLRYDLPRGALNRWLLAHQYQRRLGDGSYEANDYAKSQGWAYLHAWMKGSKSGVNLKWRTSFIDTIIDRVRQYAMNE